MREIVHIQAGQCGNQIGAKVSQPFSLQEAYFECHGKTFGSIDEKLKTFLVQTSRSTFSSGRMYQIVELAIAMNWLRGFRIRLIYEAPRISLSSSGR